MKYIQLKIVNTIKKNVEISLLALLLFISVFITQIYNSNNKKIENETLNILNNSYFKSTLAHLFKNLRPRYEDLNYTVKSNDSIISILKNLSVDDNDINKISKILNITKSTSLKTGQKLSLTLDNSKSKKKLLVY